MHFVARAAVVTGFVLLLSAPARAGTLVVSGGGGIYTVSSTGRGLKRIPGTTRLDSYPVWSPDGATVAFTRYHKRSEQACYEATGDGQCGEEEVYVVKPDGSALRQVTDEDALTDPCGATDRTYGWSPDGGALLFASQRYDGRDGVGSDRCGGWQLWTAPPAGGEPTRITRASAGGCQFEPQAAWSTRNAIAWHGPTGNCKDNVLVASAPGRPGRVITRNRSEDVFYGLLDFSPRGDRLAVVRQNLRTRKRGIVVMGLNGASARTVADGSSLAWAPDGKSIAFFACDDSFGCAIRTVRASGGASRLIVRLPKFDDAVGLDWRAR